MERKVRKQRRQGDTERTGVNEGGRLRFEGHREQLLPDIPDSVTLGEIIPKLSWKSSCSLESVSPAWLHASRSRELHHGRVINGVLESLFIRRFGAADLSYELLGLYSGPFFYFELPPLPVCERGIPKDCQCVTLDGKIYALGGELLDFSLVYVLDLAGSRKWKQCASLLHKKKSFSCAALDGKVYVVGSDFESVHVAEVYDPKADTWSLIEPMPLSWRREGPIRAVGEELLVYSVTMDSDIKDLDNALLVAEVYNPLKDEWRVKFFSDYDSDDSENSDVLDFFDDWINDDHYDVVAGSDGQIIDKDYGGKNVSGTYTPKPFLSDCDYPNDDDGYFWKPRPQQYFIEL